MYMSEYPQSKIVVLCGRDKIVARLAPETTAVLYPEMGIAYVRIGGEEERIELDVERLAEYLERRLGD